MSFSFCKKIKTLQLFIACFIFGSSFSQKKEITNLHKDDSLLKQSYLKEATAKFNQTVNTITGKNSNDYKKMYEERFKEISALITSSTSITDKNVNAYLQKIVKKIVDANPELQKLDTRVMFTRDDWPNAYSMGDGTIAINAFLFLQMHNEAELAFTICHELAHYYLNHGNAAIEKYVETLNSKDFQDELKKIAKEEFKVNEKAGQLAKAFVFNNRRHSREKEREADLQGFVFLLKSGYKVEASKSMLEVLENVDEAKLYTPLNLSQSLQFSTYPFNARWIKKESSIFSKVGKEDGTITPQEKDSLKTHPDCKKRIAYLSDSLAKYESSGVMFSSDSSSFLGFKKTFVAEIVEETFRNKKLSKNLYYSLQMMNDAERKAYATYSTLRCLLTIYEEQQNHTLGKSIDHENKYFAEDYNLLLRMLGRISLEEIKDISKAFTTQYTSTMSEYDEWNSLVQKLNKL